MGKNDMKHYNNFPTIWLFLHRQDLLLHSAFLLYLLFLKAYNQSDEFTVIKKKT